MKTFLPYVSMQNQLPTFGHDWSGAVSNFTQISYIPDNRQIQYMKQDPCGNIVGVVYDTSSLWNQLGRCI